LKHAQIVVQGVAQALVKEFGEGFVSFAPLRLLRRANTGGPVCRADGYWRMTATDEDQVHQEPRYPAVAVVEGVDVCEPAVSRERSAGRERLTTRL